MTVLTIITLTKDDLKGLNNTYQSLLASGFFELDVEWLIVAYEAYLEFDCDKKYPINKIFNASSGIYQSMNIGVQHASGRYVNFLNSGDKLLSDQSSLEQVICLLKGLTPDLLCLPWINNYGGRKRLVYPSLLFGIRKYSRMASSHQSMLINREIQSNYPYNSALKICADFDFYLQCLQLKLNFTVIRHITPWAEFQTDGYSSKHPIKLAKESLIVLKKAPLKTYQYLFFSMLIIVRIFLRYLLIRFATLL